MNLELSSIKLIENLVRRQKGAISLAQGIPIFKTDGQLVRRLSVFLRDPIINRYSPPSGLLSLRNLISKQLRDRRMNYDPETEIIVTAGASEALTATLISLFRKGDELVVPTPAYPAYFKASSSLGLKILPVELRRSEGWALDFDRLLSVSTRRTKAVLLCQPNNPTGSIFK